MATTHFLWDRLENNVAGEFDEGGNVVASYLTKPRLYGDVMSQRRADSGARYYHKDGLGTVTELTDQAGNVTDTFRSTAFGETLQSTGATTSPYKYVGAKGYYVDNGLDSLAVRRRRYSPNTARWLSVDPLSQDTLSESQTTLASEYRTFNDRTDLDLSPFRFPISQAHAYEYAANAPTTFVDATGRDPTSVGTYVQGTFSRRKATCLIRLAGGSAPTPDDLEQEYPDATDLTLVTTIDGIINTITRNGCCRVVFFGHQGGDIGNCGGMTMWIGGHEKGTPITIFPNADFQARLKKALAHNGCGTKCAIETFGCTCISPERKSNRQAIADDLQCSFSGTVPNMDPRHPEDPTTLRWYRPNPGLEETDSRKFGCTGYSLVVPKQRWGSCWGPPPVETLKPKRVK